MVSSRGLGDVYKRQLRPLAIIEDLELKRPIYAKTAAHGHFGRTDPDFTWERTDRVQELRSAAGL